MLVSQPYRFPVFFMIPQMPNGPLDASPDLNVEFWEDAKGNFGLHFPNGGIPMKEFLVRFQEAHERVLVEEKAAMKKCCKSGQSIGETSTRRSKRRV